MKFKVLRNFVLAHKLWSGVGALVLLIIILSWSLGGNGKLNTTTPQLEDLVRIVKVSGKVVPGSKVDLGFELSGTVSQVAGEVGQRVNDGDVLVRLDSSTISADILKAEAELASAEAELNKLEGHQSYESSIENARRALNQTIRDAYTSASDAVYNKSDRFFRNPKTSYPEVLGVFKDVNDLRDSVNKSRPIIGQVLIDWSNLIGSPVKSYSDAEIIKSKEYLAKISTFLSQMVSIVNSYEADSSMPQSDIDVYKSDMASAKSGLNTANQNLISAEKTLANLMADVPIQVAKVEASRANLLNLQSKGGKNALVAPFAGIVSRQDAKVGQAVSLGESLVSVISQDQFIETYVPEVSIGEIEIGNSAKVTLDAYGEEVIFDAKVVSLDPAETIRDGVSTYKVKLSFVNPDKRILSGMTANIDIETLRKPGVALIPERAVVKEAGASYIYVLKSKKPVKTRVGTGERDTQGNIELLSGTSIGAEILIDPPKE